VASIRQIPTQHTIRGIQRIQAITIVWMSVEAAVSFMGSLQSRPTRFGGDSAVELLSATVVLWRFPAHPVQEHAERRAFRIAGDGYLLHSPSPYRLWFRVVGKFAYAPAKLTLATSMV
jgi:hypothetical protein